MHAHNATTICKVDVPQLQACCGINWNCCLQQLCEHQMSIWFHFLCLRFCGVVLATAATSASMLLSMTTWVVSKPSLNLYKEVGTWAIEAGQHSRLAHCEQKRLAATYLASCGHQIQHPPDLDPKHLVHHQKQNLNTVISATRKTIPADAQLTLLNLHHATAVHSLTTRVSAGAAQAPQPSI